MPKLSNTTYDRVKWFVQIVLPAFGALCFGLGKIFNLDSADEIVGICALVATFLGSILGVSSKQYNDSDASKDGDLIVTTDGGGVQNVLLALNDDPENIIGKKQIVFKVVEQSTDNPPT